MSNLLRADLYKLTHLKSFYVIILLTALFHFLIILDLSFYPESYQSTYDHVLEIAFWPFSVWQFMPIVIPLALGIFICLFVTLDFSNGTMRDPVTLGHRRMHVFLSKSLVSGFGAALIILICMIVSILSSFTMFEGLSEVLNWNDVIQFGVRVILVMILAFAQGFMFTAIAFMVRNTAIVMAVHFSVALFITMILGSVFQPNSSSFYYWLGTALTKVVGPLQLEGIGAIIVIALSYMLLSILVGFFTFVKRDMK